MPNINFDINLSEIINIMNTDHIKFKEILINYPNLFLLKYEVRSNLENIIKSNNIEIIKVLYDCNINLDMAINANLDSLLHIAINNNKYDIVKLLLIFNANINVENIYKQTPLFYAINNDNYDLVDLLIKNNANINTIDNRNNIPISIAIRKENYKITKLLCKKGALIFNNNQYIFSEHPVDIIIQKNNKKYIKLLLKYSINFNYSIILIYSFKILKLFLPHMNKDYLISIYGNYCSNTIYHEMIYMNNYKKVKYILKNKIPTIEDFQKKNNDHYFMYVENNQNKQTHLNCNVLELAFSKYVNAKKTGYQFPYYEKVDPKIKKLLVKTYYQIIDKKEYKILKYNEYKLFSINNFYLQQINIKYYDLNLNKQIMIFY